MIVSNLFPGPLCRNEKTNFVGVLKWGDTRRRGLTHIKLHQVPDFGLFMLDCACRGK